MHITRKILEQLIQLAKSDYSLENQLSFAGYLEGTFVQDHSNFDIRKKKNIFLDLKNDADSDVIIDGLEELYRTIQDNDQKAAFAQPLEIESVKNLTENLIVKISAHF